MSFVRKCTPKRIAAFMLALILTVSAISVGTSPKAEAATMTLAQLQAKFPHGKYWNHAVGAANAPNSYTSTPCKHHSNNCDYYGNCGCNSYSNASQCHGFALKLGYDAFGSNPRNWSKLTNMNSLKAGDIIRYGGHSIFVTAVSGSNITFGDCNYSGTCQIRWNATTTKSNISSKLTYVLTAPQTLSSTAKKHIATDFNPTIKNGTYTLKLAHTSGKMLNVYDGSNKCENGTNITLWSKDGSNDQKFYFKHVSGGKYLIYAVCSGASGSVYKRVLDLNVGSNNKIDLGDKFDVWTQSSDWNNCQLFYIVPVGSGKYVIELASTPNAVLAAKNATEAATNGGAVTLRDYENFTTQQWYFYNASGSAQVDPSIDSSTSSSKTYYTGTYKVSATDGLNIRSGATTSHSKLDAIPYNTTVSVSQISGSWGKTIYDGTDGWICLDYTTYVSPFVSSISVKTAPTKTSYFVGETLSTAGLSLNINYSNNTTGTATSGFTCSNTSLSTAGTKAVTVTYGGKTCTFSVNVKDIDLSSISIKTMPTKTNYFVGETLNTAGLTLNLSYNNGSTSTVTSGFSCSPTTLSTSGTQKITVTYGTKSTSFNVNVTAVTLDSISVKTAPSKLGYFVGNNLDTTGLALNLYYNNGSTGTATSGFSCTPSVFNYAGKQTVTVNYNGKTTSFDVNVSEVTVSAISINKLPTKTEYFVGETLDTSDLLLNVSYSDGSTGTASGGFTCTPSTLSTAGTQVITVILGGKTATFNVNVTAVTLDSISVKTAPAKLSYFVGSNLDTTGLTLNLYYNNGSIGTATSGFYCTPQVLNVAGTQTVTVNYSEKTTTFDVDVSEVSVSEISIANLPAKTDYYIGEALDTSGLLLNVLYTDGSTGTIANGFSCSPQTLSVAGTQAITVSFGGKTTSFNVNVSDITLTAISIKQLPSVNTYTVGDTLDTSGLVLELTYSNGEKIEIINGYECTPSTLATHGTQQITVLYNGKSCTFYVTVNEEQLCSIEIQRPSVVSLNYGDILVLHAKSEDLPQGAKIKWEIIGNSFNFASSNYGETCMVVSKGNGTSTITATIVDQNDEPIVDKSENEIRDEVTLQSKAGFFQKLISFFKNLFRIGRIIAQAISSENY